MRGTYDDASEITDVYDDDDEYQEYLDGYDAYYEQLCDDDEAPIYAPRSRGAWRAWR